MMESRDSPPLVPGGITANDSEESLAEDNLYPSTSQSQPDNNPSPSTSQSQPEDTPRLSTSQSQPEDTPRLSTSQSQPDNNPSPSTSQSQDDNNLCPSTSQSHDSGKFSIQTSLIPQASDQGDELSGLGINVYNQEDLEQGIMAQVDQAMARDEEERIKKLIERQLSSVLDDIRSTREELERIGRVIRSVISSNKGEISKEAKKHLEAAKRQRENKLKQMKKLKAKRGALLSKLDGQEMDAEAVNDDEDLQFFDQALSSGAAAETEGERLIKLGEMTPFGTIVKSQAPKTPVKPPAKPHVLSDFEMFLQNKDSDQTSKKTKSVKPKHAPTPKAAQLTSSGATEARLSEKLPKPNWFDERDKKVYNRERDFSKLKGKRSYPKLEHNFSEDPELSEASGGSEDEWSPGSDGEEDREALPLDGPSPAKKRRGKASKAASTSEKDHLGLINEKHSLEKDTHSKRARDDGNFAYFQKRLKAHRKSEAARKKQQHDAGLSDSDEEETEFEGGLKVPGRLWKRLFGYQRTGVKWLWELHCQQAGGIVGDEMGLGKTIQTIAFLASLKTCKIRQRPFRYVGLGPTIIVCPATVMHQWVREFHKWWPEFRVAILHSSGSFTGTEESLIHNIVNQHGVLVTSYSSLVGHQDALLQHDWHYIILDEGHKIRNPDAQATLACKQFRTPHRIILSGSPIQNNLKELWSLFDFVFPGKLGTLPDFMAHFSVPIVQGGYANASQVQVQTAYKCACILRDTIAPYLLRRMKADVKSAVKLPGKSEQVLFCRMTDEQRDVYQEYLDSKECSAILAGKYKVFAGLITLRKICNHPDISTGGPRVLVGQSTDGDETLEYGYWRRSGKLIVVESLLKLWKKQGQRVLLFSQSKQMLDILERFVNKSGYSYLRMDGGTTISSRQPLIHKYNSNPNIFLFLLTTRVGGLGVNLTGANRVVIFDPDWNPSTDMQARERAWRIGQNRQVTIYRLLTTGTIEEKIYHRQIFKQFLTNRVLKDPKQRRFFKTNDLYELFTLGTKDDQNGTETGAIFAGIGSEVTLGKRQNRFDAMKEEALPVKKPALRQSKSASALTTNSEGEVSAKQEDSVIANGAAKPSNGLPSIPKIPKKAPPVLDRQEQLREMARKLSEKIGQKTDVADKTATVDSNNSQKEKEQKRKKKKKRVKDAEFEGEKIPHLAKLRDYKHSGQKTEESPENLSAQQDDYVLKRLFKKTGIQGALKHDVIVGASKTDYALVEGEAERVAREAAAALKRSRVSCRNALSGIPTWTGQHGQGGAPARPKFGRKKNSLIAETKISASKAQLSDPKNVGEDDSDSPKAFHGTQAGNRTGVGLHSSSKQMVMSSGELLQRMRARNIVSESGQTVDEEAEDNGVTTPAPSTGDNKDIDLITDIRNFIAFQCHMDGQASTQELLDEFGVKLPPGDSAKFKAMLRQICDFDRSSDVGIWRLKPVYR